GEPVLVDLHHDAEDVEAMKTVDAGRLQDGKAVVVFDGFGEVEEPGVGSNPRKHANAILRRAAATLVVFRPSIEGHGLAAVHEVEPAGCPLVRLDEVGSTRKLANDGLLPRCIGGGR